MDTTFRLTTTRLAIYPLQLADFERLIENIETYENSRGWRASGERWDAHTQEAMRGLCEMLRESMASGESEYRWLTNWRIVAQHHKNPEVTENKKKSTDAEGMDLCVGSACFMGPPDETGTVGIGYGTHEAYRNRGFMTEALGAMVRWAKEQPEVKRVTAETEAENLASWKVLENNGFRQIGEKNGLLQWTTND